MRNITKKGEEGTCHIDNMRRQMAKGSCYQPRPEGAGSEGVLLQNPVRAEGGKTGYQVRAVVAEGQSHCWDC